MKAWLSQTGTQVESRDFFGQPFSEEELLRIIGDRTVSEFFSWSSPSFRKLGLEREGLTDDLLISLMLDEPRLIRRPLILVNGSIVGPLTGVDKTIRVLSGLINLG